MSKLLKFSAINQDGKIRDCDGFGCGHFGASRGTRTHKGLDFAFAVGGAVLAPFPCKVTRHGYPYADDLTYRLVECVGLGAYSDYRFKVMYVKELPTIGREFKEGEILCKADDISSKYGSSMTNHVHFELYIKNELVNPTFLI
ncbi:MAG: hypothetical protein RH981_18955 [Arenibacter sp.]